jgi:hypothetical protein
VGSSWFHHHGPFAGAFTRSNAVASGGRPIESTQAVTPRLSIDLKSSSPSIPNSLASSTRPEIAINFVPLRSLNSIMQLQHTIDTDYGLPIPIYRPFITIDQYYDSPLPLRTIKRREFHTIQATERKTYIRLRKATIGNPTSHLRSLGRC